MTNGGNEKHKKGIRILIALLFAGAIIAGFYFLYNLNRVTTDDAYIEGRVHVIAPKVSGTVLKLNVDDNQRAKKDELLLEIDPLDYALKVSEARANMGVRLATMEQAMVELTSPTTMTRSVGFVNRSFSNAIIIAAVCSA